MYITGCPGISWDGLGHLGLYWCVYLGMFWDGLYDMWDIGDVLGYPRRGLDM